MHVETSARSYCRTNCCDFPTELSTNIFIEQHLKIRWKIESWQMKIENLASWGSPLLRSPPIRQEVPVQKLCAAPATEAPR